ncbi:DUF932 domain-containing protein [Bilophila wadsworthia]|uniref:DUF932 domain-containing protein n=1 Tax=Bilophila wadsworthia TaxID=35833 RepID=UPI0035219EFF
MRNPFEPMSFDEMRCLAPSIFAETPHESRSDRYAYIPTIEVVTAMMKEGFLPFSVMQARSRSESRREYTKHLIRFRHAEMLKANPHAGQLFPEIVLVNSHDGSSAYQVMSGIFRLVCTNGMITGTHYGDYKIRHQGDIAGQVIDASYKVLTTAEQSLNAAGEWSGIRLTEPEQIALARAAHAVRFADAEGNISTPITPEQLLRPRRMEDWKDDLWSTFNRVQENTLKGGLSAFSYEGGRRRRVTSRKIGGITEDVRINRALWMLGEEMKKLKTA